MERIESYPSSAFCSAGPDHHDLCTECGLATQRADHGPNVLCSLLRDLVARQRSDWAYTQPTQRRRPGCTHRATISASAGSASCSARCCRSHPSTRCRQSSTEHQTMAGCQTPSVGSTKTRWCVERSDRQLVRLDRSHQCFQRLGHALSNRIRPPSSTADYGNDLGRASVVDDCLGRNWTWQTLAAGRRRLGHSQLRATDQRLCNRLRRLPAQQLLDGPLGSDRARANGGIACNSLARLLWS